MFKKLKLFWLLAAIVCLQSSPVIAEQSSDIDIKFSRQVTELMRAVNPQNVWINLTALTQFPDRAATSQNGVDTANWIKVQLASYARNSPRTDVSIYSVNAFAPGEENIPELPKQPSIILKIGDSTEPAIVIGAHMDTVTRYEDEDHMPGADDDGSGTAALLEISRVLLDSNIKYKKPIYLIFYAAEEMMMEGSFYVVKDFQDKHIAVDAALQMDMIGQRQFNDKTLWLGTSKPYKDDPTSSTNSPMLNAKAIALGKAFLNVPVKESDFDGLSDHISWMHVNVKTIFLNDISCESAQPGCQRYEHTLNDTMDRLSLEHMTNYLKLALAFTVEEAEPVSK